MTAQAHPTSVVERLANTFRDWLRHRQELREIHRLDTAEFDRIASDLRISPADLDELVRQGPHAADELSRLLEALGLGEQDLARIEPMILHDMERVCALCGHKGECHRDLAAGISAERYKEYCLNAPTIEELDKTARK
jgi:uncharacterized protein YjiS (DUF1127 family)